MGENELTNNELKLKIILQGHINGLIQHHRQQEVTYRKRNLSFSHFIHSRTPEKASVPPGLEI